MNLIDEFRKLNVQYDYGWKTCDEDAMLNNFDFVSSHINIDECTIAQLVQVVSLIFDVGYGGKFEPCLNDFYGSLQGFLERGLLDGLLAEFSDDNHLLVIDALKVIDKNYQPE